MLYISQRINSLFLDASIMSCTYFPALRHSSSSPAKSKQSWSSFEEDIHSNSFEPLLQSFHEHAGDSKKISACVFVLLVNKGDQIYNIIWKDYWCINPHLPLFCEHQHNLLWIHHCSCRINGFHGSPNPRFYIPSNIKQNNESSYIVMQQNSYPWNNLPTTNNFLIIHKHWSPRNKYDSAVDNVSFSLC